MEEAPENGKETSHSAQANGIYEWILEIRNYKKLTWVGNGDCWTAEGVLPTVWDTVGCCCGCCCCRW